MQIIMQFWYPITSKPQKLVLGSCQACRVKDAAWHRFNAARGSKEAVARWAGKQRNYELRREMWLKTLYGNQPRPVLSSLFEWNVGDAP